MQPRIEQSYQQEEATAIYQFFAATNKAKSITVRSMWQRNNAGIDSLRPLRENRLENYYRENFEAPKVDLAILPRYSFVLQFTFTLAQPYISRDEQDFYILDNPIRKDKVFELPYVASTSWKGSLRAALWKEGYREENEQIYRLFGNNKGEENQEKLHEGRLYFFPTFFTQKGLEIINPHDREHRVGKNPILFEAVPISAKGVYTLLYVPFDRIGRDEKATREQVAHDLEVVAKGLQAMFSIYGFGAKTSSGFGLAQESVSEGTLRLRVMELAKKQVEETVIPQPIAPALPRYLESPDRLKPEYLTEEGTFREQSDIELKKMSKNDKQLYDKAKSWWEREGRQLAEAAKLPKAVEPVLPEMLPKAQPISWPKWSFDSFGQLLERAEEVANTLSNEGGAV